MQAPDTTLLIAIEIYVILLIGAAILFVHTRKLKSLLRRQQEKLLGLLQERQRNQNLATKTALNVPIKPTQNYKSYLNDILAATSEQYSRISSKGDIGAKQADDSSQLQRILALRYAFLRAEELGTTEVLGSTQYWNIFQQALEPLLTSSNIHDKEIKEELATYKKHIANLEKFKLLFFDMEKQWANAQANAENYYEQLTSMSNAVAETQGFSEILEQYHSVYDDIYKTIIQTTSNPNTITTKSIVNITRQDPRAAAEILKLRNVAAEQHRTINQLQKKLAEATTPIEKETVFQELQQQLQRQTRFVQESETCIQLLEDELAKAHDELSLQGAMLAEQSAISEENQQMKGTLHSLSLENKDLASNLATLEKENAALKSDNQPEQEKLHDGYIELKKQYAELEEKYLDLKLKN
ncbi:MAG: hypothetical protein V4660_07425 [Pseudomonadota bacterium]